MSSCGHMKECKQIQKQLGNKLGFFIARPISSKEREEVQMEFIQLAPKSKHLASILLFIGKCKKINETLNKNLVLSLLQLNF